MALSQSGLMRLLERFGGPLLSRPVCRFAHHNRTINPRGSLLGVVRGVVLGVGPAGDGDVLVLALPCP